MKKITAIFICVCLFMLSITSFAAVDDSYKQILESVKARIPDTAEFDDFSASQSSSRGVKVFSFSWSNSETGESMEVQCLENGIVTRFNTYGNETYQKRAMSDISKEEALEKAKTAFYKLNPQLKDKTIIKNSNENKQLWETRQNFVVTRIENGIEVYGDSGNIEMDMNADKILWFYMNWNVFDAFPNPENAISLEDAQKTFIEKLGIHLIYKAKTEDGKIKPYLVYTPKDAANKYIDMKGEVIKCNPYPAYTTGYGAITNDKVMMEDAVDGFSKAEIAEFEKLEGMISQETAQKIAESEKLVDLDGFKLESVNLSRDYYDKEKYIYIFTYVSDKLRVNVSVDARNGEIISFSNYSYDEGETVISQEEASKKLQDAVKKLCTTSFGEYELVKDEEYFVEFNRVIDGVKFPHDSIKAGINKYTGKISYYSKTYSKADFPSKDNVISLNMTYKIAFDLFSYRLKYVPTYEGEKGQIKAKLVYAFDSESFDIDPFTGEKYNHDNGQDILVYEDIENHYAKNYIEELASYGIGLGNARFMPDSKIKQKELISLLVRAFYNYYSTYPISEKYMEEDYETAVREEIISEEEIDQESYVTRKDAAKFFVNALGYGVAAKIDSIYNCPFIDVTENVGFISILYGLGIVSGNGEGVFNPDAHLLRGDAMIMLYKCLSR